MTDCTVGEVVKTGYLTKSPPLSRAPVSQWHKRWFVLMDSKVVFPMAERYIRLSYYQSEADAKGLADPKGTINLSSCVCVIPHTDPIKNFKHVFDVCTEDRVYHLSAESAEDKWAWINTLKDLLFPPKNSKVSSDARPAGTDGVADDIKRTKDGGRPVRPHSFNPSSSGGPSKISSRPLPPVPGNTSPGSPAPVPRKHRPLPSPPTSGLSSSNPTIHIQPVGPQSSPSSASNRIKKLPPSKPAPYRKNVSEPSPPVPAESPVALPRSGSFSPSKFLPEDYQEFVARPDLVAPNLLSDNMEDNYSLASSVPRRRPPSPVGPRPPPSSKPSAPQKAPQKPTKPPKPSVLPKPGHSAPSKLAKPAAAATPPVTSRTKRPIPTARNKQARPSGPHHQHTSSSAPQGSAKFNGGSDYSVLEEEQSDYSVLEQEQPDYSVLEEEQPDYSVLEEEQPDYSVLEQEQPDYSVLDGEQPDYSDLDGNRHDYSILDDEQENYSCLEDTRIIDEEQHEYGEIQDTGQDYSNIDTEVNYGNIDDAANDYSVLQNTVVPGYNPRNTDYSHLDTTQGTTESPPPPIRHSSLAPHHTSGNASSNTSSHTSSLTSPTVPQDYLCSADLGISRTVKQAPRQQPRPRRSPVKGGAGNWMSASNNDDYSRLNH